MTAAFSGGSGPGGRLGRALRSLGRPVVVADERPASRSRSASARPNGARRACGRCAPGRIETALAFTAAAGRGDGRPVPRREARLLHVRPAARRPHAALDGLSRPLRRARDVEPVHADARAADGRRRGHALVGHPPLPLVAAGRRRRPGLPRQAARPRGALPDPRRSDHSRRPAALPRQLPDQARGDRRVRTGSDADLVRLAAIGRLADARESRLSWRPRGETRGEAMRRGGRTDAGAGRARSGRRQRWRALDSDDHGHRRGARQGDGEEHPGRDQLRRRKHEVLRRVHRQRRRRADRETPAAGIAARNAGGRLRRSRTDTRATSARRRQRPRRRASFSPKSGHVPEHVVGHLSPTTASPQRATRETSAPPSPRRPVARSTAATRAGWHGLHLGSSRPARRSRVFQTPAAGSVFQGWGGQCSGQAASCTVQMNGDRQVGRRLGAGGRLDGAAHRQRRGQRPRVGRRASTARAPASPTWR